MNTPETQSAVSSMRLLGELVETLTSSMQEIRNLQDKMAKKEEEGWEGSKRRCVLRMKTEEVLAKARTELKKATEGDGI